MIYSQMYIRWEYWLDIFIDALWQEFPLGLLAVHDQASRLLISARCPVKFKPGNQVSGFY